MQFANLLSGLTSMLGFGGRLFVWSTAAPAGSEVGYAGGCLWIRCDNTTSNKLYINTGTASSASWTVVGAQS